MSRSSSWSSQNLKSRVGRILELVDVEHTTVRPPGVLELAELDDEGGVGKSAHAARMVGDEAGEDNVTDVVRAHAKRLELALDRLVGCHPRLPVAGALAPMAFGVNGDVAVQAGFRAAGATRPAMRGSHAEQRRTGIPSWQPSSFEKPRTV